ncbi:hypothetical protein TorRG33x02_104370 [Trema orientale]|uniref:Uncharacterized protein n=1 Tax=Trema orientale TaxID=63057 RepID=A0A2P5F7G1_TREOI|nr:hypothetical protein TorRG33x02_104370 [Trema orientale]
MPCCVVKNSPGAAAPCVWRCGAKVLMLRRRGAVNLALRRQGIDAMAPRRRAPGAAAPFSWRCGATHWHCGAKPLEPLAPSHVCHQGTTLVSCASSHACLLRLSRLGAPLLLILTAGTIFGLNTGDCENPESSVKLLNTVKFINPGCVLSMLVRHQFKG